MFFFQRISEDPFQKGPDPSLKKNFDPKMLKYIASFSKNVQDLMSCNIYQVKKIYPLKAIFSGSRPGKFPDP